MNNPLEAVTQAVNSLVTALKLPDESAKANEVLGEMSFPQFSRLLPYRDYNQESGLFMNDTTMGFMLEAIPINGANESIVEALDHMLRTKLPRGIPLCIYLMSSQLVGDRIEYGLREFSWSGEQAERFNAITRAYYMKAAATQFPLPEGMNLPLTLRHYLVAVVAGLVTQTAGYHQNGGTGADGSGPCKPHSASGPVVDVSGRAWGLSAVCPGVGAESVPSYAYPAGGH
ncbi:conjugal transfer ATP-binding protein TraC [Escherichia coli]|nr:conjugal transfer ATP-binding protein TraC [Escherichia coli]